MTGGEGLYWCSFVDDDQYECFIAKNMRFKQSLSIRRIFGDGEYPSMISTTPGFLHLQDHDFCLLLQSSVTHPASHYIYPASRYIYCVILEISPKDNGLSISIMSIQKYSPDEDIDFLYCAKIQNKESKETVKAKEREKDDIVSSKKTKIKLYDKVEIDVCNLTLSIFLIHQ